MIELKEEAKICHDTEVANYNISKFFVHNYLEYKLEVVFKYILFTENSKINSNFNWIKTVMSKGTVSDKIAANTVTIQDNPICNLDNIRNLVGMVKVGKNKECLAVIGKNDIFATSNSKQ